jgi:hypothetical protein
VTITNSLGCKEGLTAVPAAAAILDFGQPWYANGRWGMAILDDPNWTFAPLPDVEWAIRGWLAGYFRCSADSTRMALVVGTNNLRLTTNYLTAALTDLNYSPGQPTRHGTQWALLVNRVGPAAATTRPML